MSAERAQAQGERAAAEARAAGFGETVVAAAADLLEVIPADVTTDPDGEPLDEETCQAIRRSRARQWALAGFTDPVEVGAWIQTGVVIPEIAETARRRGFRPGDPWVPRGWGGSSSAQWRRGGQEPVAGPVQRRRNRRQARAAWTERQQRHAEGQAHQDRAAAALREIVIAGSGSSATFSAFDLAVSAPADRTPSSSPAPPSRSPAARISLPIWPGRPRRSWRPTARPRRGRG